MKTQLSITFGLVSVLLLAFSCGKGIDFTKPEEKAKTSSKPSMPIADRVDEEVEFEGGLSNFRTQVANEFRDVGFKPVEHKANIVFVVDSDGSITDVKASGNNAMFNQECERALSQVKIKCKPAKLNGDPVRSRFKMPMKMQFE
jgi:periplasmic protein TonB